MKFVDEATIDVKAGHGGKGASTFRREKFVPFGGPDGGNGGVGGSVILIADLSVHTLLDFRFQPRWHAEDGAPGEGSHRSGRAGQDLIIKLPVGTSVIDQSTGEVVYDLVDPGVPYTLARGGRGGKGNEFFKSATNQTPEYAQPGEAGESGSYLLSLKLVADVGIIGFPNAGKSTLISRISAAKPKIADYPFTTLVPNLGVVRSTTTGSSYVVADIPGLIPDAHLGKGLGIQFLKHVERTKVLAHVIDASVTNAEGEALDHLEAYEQINTELAHFSEELRGRKQVVVISKIDVLPNEEAVQAILEKFKNKDIEAIAISSATGRGLSELIEKLRSMLN